MSDVSYAEYVQSIFGVERVFKEDRKMFGCKALVEQVAGFQRLDDGKFEEVMLIRNQEDLESFRKQYGIKGDIEKIY